MRPYKNLWANVLWQAVLDAVRFAHATRPTPLAYRRDALDWFAAEASGVGSFVWVCELMRLDPGRVRERVRAMIAAADKRERQFMPRFIVQAV